MTDLTAAPYDRWIGRKATALKRPTLDCGCPNAGKVYFHLWCDRLACQEHADTPHDCGLFKGKSGIEEEAVEPEAAVEAPALPPRQPFTLDPESHRALYGPVEAIRQAQPLRSVRLAETWRCPHCDFSTFIGGLKRLHEVACPAPLVDELEAPEPVVAAPDRYMTDEHMAQIRAVSAEDFRAESLGEWPPDPVRIRRRSPEARRAYLAAERARLVARGASADWLSAFDELAADAAALDELVEPDPPGAQVTVMTEAEAAGWRQTQQLSLECSRSRPLCSGCDGLAMDNFPCVHDCHEPAVCSCPEVDVSTLASRPRPQIARGYDPGCRVHAAPNAPHVDAALEPDLDEPWQHIYTGSGRWHLVGMGDRAREVPCDCPKPVPWWRRMLPGGTR